MARPMILIKEKLLNEIYNKYKQGVPVLKLIRQYSLGESITAPTLTKLLSYKIAMETTKNKEIKQSIKTSLFPEWLDANKGNVQTNPKEWYYVSKMPLGEWIVR